MDEEIYCCSKCELSFTRNHGIYVLGESIFLLKGPKAQAEISNALEAEDDVPIVNVDETDAITINGESIAVSEHGEAHGEANWLLWAGCGRGCGAGC